MEKLLFREGIQYRVLVLPEHKIISMAVLEKTEELLQQGATVIGYKPEKLTSLVGGTETKQKFQKLANKIWGEQTSEEGEKEYGSGHVARGMTAREYLDVERYSCRF
ncbi:MAG: glycosyl hydrolase [Cyclobacteriaceae bacterium]|nr:glycosyl hydrolase [Cyclobacteriaceae bacterium]